VVKPGDCVSSIAFEHGVLPERVWDRPENRALRDQRADMHVLLPGDVVFVPDREARVEHRPTGATHRFRRRAVPDRLRVRFVDDEDRPRAGVRYELIVGEQSSVGRTDGDGLVLEWIPPSAKSAKLILHGERRDEEYELDVGFLDPVTTLAGVRDRLRNLGYDCGDEQGDAQGPITERRLREFQEAQRLGVTGIADGDTRAALTRVHGS
jgi:hypothetical protein